MLLIYDGDDLYYSLQEAGPYQATLKFFPL